MTGMSYGGKKWLGRKPEVQPDRREADCGKPMKPMSDAKYNRLGKSGGDAASLAPAGDRMTDSQSTTHIFVWVAAAAILLIAGFVSYEGYELCTKRRKTGAQEVPTGPRVAATPAPAPERARQPSVPAKQAVAQGEPTVFAAVVRAEQARKDAGVPEKAAALFAGAMMRWTGQTTEWEKRVAEMNLARLHSCIPDEDNDMIVTFHARLLRDEIPSSRLDARRCLDRLASSGGLTCGDLYRRPVGIDPSRFGFREY